PKGEEETTEIDVLMIHAKGLFVFESKNYSGWIFGSEHQKNWYQTLPQGRGRSHKESFYNPIMQNRTHIKHLKVLVGEDIPTHSIITFSERCTLKKVEVKSDDIRVINRDKVYDTVATICAQRDVAALSNEQISEIYDKLYPYTQVSNATKEQHIQNTEKKQETTGIQPVVEDRLATEQEKRCPRCNNVLVLRTATKGTNAGNQFYGCSNFPKCKYIEKLEVES
ncbi:MAG: NERD domain-containing protein, partial [Oscillospiraceae bacterium]|nr:NERD domain-containing protein [Oscillospiraceae bacterium]